MTIHRSIIAVPDVGAAREFYAAVLGWEFEDPGPADGGYTLATVRGHAVAGVGPQQSAEQPTQWLLYLASADADATASAVTANGGAVLLPPGDSGAYGRFLIAADPTGATFAVWQARQHIGAGLVNEAGGLTWEDLRSTDPGGAQDFYAQVFGFDMQPVEMAPADYRTFHPAGDPAPFGGMGGFMGPPGPSAWVLYFGVDDADAAAAAAGQVGGVVVDAPGDTPFGRLAGITDRDGAFFYVIQRAADAAVPNRAG